MKLLVLSDLHIDTRDEFGTFGWEEMDLIEQIEVIRDRYSVDKVVFNGDVFELYKYSYDEIERANPVLMSYMKDKDFVFIKGNHDIVNQFGLEAYQVVNADGVKIHIEHGHKADWLNGTKLGRWLCRVALGGLKKLSSSKTLMGLYYRIVEFDDQVNRVPKKYNTFKYLTYALRLLKEHDVVILAHTHKLESHHTYYLNKKKRYLNCGSCSMGRFQGIVFDTETLHYELIKINKKDGRNISPSIIEMNNTLLCTS